MEGRENENTTRSLPTRLIRAWIGLGALARQPQLWCGLSACTLLSNLHRTLLADTAADPSPAIPPRLVWPGVAVIIVIAIFVTAALAGPIIRANSDEPSESPSSSDNPE